MTRPPFRRALGRALFGRRPPWWLLLGTVLAVAAVAVLLVRGTGGGTAERPLPLRAADVPAAVTALEQRLGGAQRYTEINAVADGVNLFVAGDGGTEAQWFYSGGRLDQLAAPGPAAADRTSFALDGVALDKAAATARAAQHLFATATITSFAVRLAGNQAVVWSVELRSSRGGLIEVTFDAAGDYVGTDFR